MLVVIKMQDLTIFTFLEENYDHQNNKTRHALQTHGPWDSKGQRTILNNINSRVDVAANAMNILRNIRKSLPGNNQTTHLWH